MGEVSTHSFCRPDGAGAFSVAARQVGGDVGAGFCKRSDEGWKGAVLSGTWGARKRLFGIHSGWAHVRAIDESGPAKVERIRQTYGSRKDCGDRWIFVILRAL